MLVLIATTALIPWGRRVAQPERLMAIQPVLTVLPGVILYL